MRFNTRPSIKTRWRRSIFWEPNNSFFFFYRTFPFELANFFVAPTTRTVTRLRYVRLRDVTHRLSIAHASIFFSAAFPIFRTRGFLSDASSNEVMRNKGIFNADALLACLRVMRKKLYHQKCSFTIFNLSSKEVSFKRKSWYLI